MTVGVNVRSLCLYRDFESKMVPHSTGERTSAQILCFFSVPLKSKKYMHTCALIDIMVSKGIEESPVVVVKTSLLLSFLLFSSCQDFLYLSSMGVRDSTPVTYFSLHTKKSTVKHSTGTYGTGAFFMHAVPRRRWATDSHVV